MKSFLIITLLLFTLYLVGFIKKPLKDIKWMSKDCVNLIKGFSILTIIWAHSCAKFNISGIQFIAGVGVSLFLICSGYGLQKSYMSNGLKKFWIKKFFKVCIPFWVVELIGLIITKKISLSVFLLDMFFVKPATSYGWFMKYIMICYLIFYLISYIGEKLKIDSKISNIMLYTMFILWFAIESLWFANPNMPFLQARQMLSFPFGIMLAKYQTKFTNNNLMLKMTGLVMLGMIFMGVTQLTYIKKLPYLISNLLALMTVFPISVSVIFACKKIPTIFNNHFIKMLGSVSYELYLSHAFSLELLNAKSVQSIFLFTFITIFAALLIKKIFKEFEKCWI